MQLNLHSTSLWDREAQKKAEVSAVHVPLLEDKTSIWSEEKPKHAIHVAKLDCELLIQATGFPSKNQLT